MPAAFHPGFGLGCERPVMYATGVENIRDVIPHPRAAGRLEASSRSCPPAGSLDRTHATWVFPFRTFPVSR